MNKLVGWLLLPSLLAAASPVTAQDLGGDWWVIGGIGRGGRSPVHTDAIEASIVRGTWKPPTAGVAVRLPDGKEAVWKSVAMTKGRVAAPRGGYAWTELKSEEEKTVLLAGKGHSLVYVNGVPRVGNPYRTSWYRIPVRLRRGSNEFLYRTGRGAIRPKLLPIEKPVFFTGLDHTLPDLIVDEKVAPGLGVVVVNAGQHALRGAWIDVTGEGFTPPEGSQLSGAALPTLGACSVYKAWVPLAGLAPKLVGDREVTLTLWAKDAKGVAQALDRLQLTLHVKKASEPHKRVYKSRVDGSAQYYVVNPPSPLPEAAHGRDRESSRKALFLSLHGASVEATNQARSYAPKTWGYLVAPTNRRPYGFDWEDWGRRDAIDVLDEVERRYPIDDSRVYLTGHSMGGHGTWQVGATHPDRFAALGPSAGWISFWSYASAPRSTTPDPIEALLQRAASPSDTLGLMHNYLQHGIYILHGDADDNVPIREARRMWKELETFHRDHQRHEEKGAGHWWNRRDSAGADCVDWREMFDFFARHRIPRNGELREIDFTTMNPAISSTCHWVAILEQDKKLARSRIHIHFDPLKARFRGTTENIRTFRLGAGPFPEGTMRFTLEIDGQKLESKRPLGAGFDLSKDAEGKWSCRSDDIDGDYLQEKIFFQTSFKQAFDRDFVLVTGTKGSEAENRWASHKARYDAETFWYRGNGSVEVVPDTDYSLAKYGDRNVILYGNSRTNAAWSVLLGKRPVDVAPGSLRIGDGEAEGRVLRGEDLACLLVQPMPDDRPGLVAAVSGTGLVGMRLCDRLPIFTSGVYYADFTVISPAMLEKGYEGVLGAGFFGRRGGMKRAETAWRR